MDAILPLLVLVAVAFLLVWVPYRLLSHRYRRPDGTLDYRQRVLTTLLILRAWVGDQMSRNFEVGWTASAIASQRGDLGGTKYVRSYIDELRAQGLVKFVTRQKAVQATRNRKARPAVYGVTLTKLGRQCADEGRLATDQRPKRPSTSTPRSITIKDSPGTTIGHSHVQGASIGGSIVSAGNVSGPRANFHVSHENVNDLNRVLEILSQLRAMTSQNVDPQAASVVVGYLDEAQHAVQRQDKNGAIHALHRFGADVSAGMLPNIAWDALKEAIRLLS